MKPLIILSGPTAVGKTALSVELAKRINASIVSADSMQVYKGMDIGTAKITKEEMQGIPHYLIDALNPSDDFNIVTFKNMAKSAIADIYGKGRIPLIVGGTAFYIQSVLYDIDFSETDENTKYRQELTQLIESRGGQYVHKMLEAVDKDAAAAIHYNDHKRMIRALEYLHETGERISEHNSHERTKAPVYDCCYFVLTDDRAAIYERINKRVDKMLSLGLAGEVRGIIEGGLAKPSDISMQGIGYKEIIPYLEGKCTLEEAAYNIKKNSRHFAKRQLTWYRRERGVIYIDRRKTPDPLGEIMSIIERSGIIDEGSV